MSRFKRIGQVVVGIVGLGTATYLAYLAVGFDLQAMRMFRQIGQLERIAPTDAVGSAILRDSSLYSSGGVLQSIQGSVVALVVGPSCKDCVEAGKAWIDMLAGADTAKDISIVLLSINAPPATIGDLARRQEEKGGRPLHVLDVADPDRFTIVTGLHYMPAAVVFRDPVSPLSVVFGMPSSEAAAVLGGIRGDSVPLRTLPMQYSGAGEVVQIIQALRNAKTQQQSGTPK